MASLFSNDGTGTEFDPAEDKISGLLSQLERVQAPGDFDFRLKARITERRSSNTARPRFLRPVAFAAPTAVIAVVGGYFAWAGFQPSQQTTVQQASIVPTEITTPAPQNVPSSPVPPVELAVTVPNGAPQPDPIVKNAIKTSDKKTGDRANANVDSGSGSFDEAAPVTKKLYPRGLDPNEKPANTETEHRAQISANELLSALGIRASFAGSGWKVESVAPGSAAGRSGVKTGDVIEAVNGNALNQSTSFNNPFSGKSVSVRRDGKSVTIALDR
jgi:hypothetical protein